MPRLAQEEKQKEALYLLNRLSFLCFYNSYWLKLLLIFKADASRNYLSYLWWIFDPVLNLFFLSGIWIFATVRHGEFRCFLLTDLIPWLWFNKTVRLEFNTGIMRLPVVRVIFAELKVSEAILNLKECEFRFNNRGNDLHLTILKILIKNPLFSL